MFGLGLCAERAEPVLRSGSVHRVGGVDGLPVVRANGVPDERDVGRAHDLSGEEE
jgi:hypothetical protein